MIEPKKCRLVVIDFGLSVLKKESVHYRKGFSGTAFYSSPQIHEKCRVQGSRLTTNHVFGFSEWMQNDCWGAVMVAIELLDNNYKNLLIRESRAKNLKEYHQFLKNNKKECMNYFRQVLDYCSYPYL